MRPSYVERTFRTLELASEDAVSAVGLADELSVDVRTARRLLDRLVAEQVLVLALAPRARYMPGPRLRRLAAALPASC
jgi:DNA-binding IclR family transcriptional regulator